MAAQEASQTKFLQSFGMRLAQLLAPGLPLATVQAAVMQVIEEAKSVGPLPAPPAEQLPDAGGAGPSFGGRKLELVFAHDCRNHGCNVPACVLCKHNPNKRCSGNFAPKYWVGDRLLAKCDGEIQVELIDTDTHQRVHEDLSRFRVEACVLEGQKYNAKCREAGEQRLDILDVCEVLLNQRGEPLLVSAAASNSARAPRVVLKFPPGASSLPLRDVKVTESSESVLAGTKRPPFRLVVRLVAEDGSRLPVRPAVSEEFVVVTKRTKNLKKQDIPALDDPIAKLNHVGKETVKKLNELKASADEMQIDLHLPRDLDRILKVKDFQRLARLSEADGHLQQKLKQLLKLSREKWDAACEHAKSAVQVDNRLRAWYEADMARGLLYGCALGDVRPDCPVALIQSRRAGGAEYMEVIPMEHQLPAQREQVADACEAAIQAWWRDGHPGWMIFTLGNRHFDSLDQIVAFSKAEREAGAEVVEGQEAGRRQDSLPASAGRDSGSPSGAGAAGREGSEQPIGNEPRPQAPQQDFSRLPDADQAAADVARSAAASHGLPEGLLPAGNSGDGYNPFEILSSLPFGAAGGHALAAAANGGAEDRGGHPRSQGLCDAAAALAAGSIPSMLPQLFSLGTLAKLGSLPSLGMLGEAGLLSAPPADDAPGNANGVPLFVKPAGKRPTSASPRNEPGDEPQAKAQRTAAHAGPASRAE